MSSTIEEIFSSIVGIIILLVFISSLFPTLASLTPKTGIDWSWAFIMLIVVLGLAIFSVFATIGKEIGDWFS